MANNCVEQPLPVPEAELFVIQVVHQEQVRHDTCVDPDDCCEVNYRVPLFRNGQMITSGYHFDTADQAHACADGMSLTLGILGYHCQIITIDERG